LPFALFCLPLLGARASSRCAYASCLLFGRPFLGEVQPRELAEPLDRLAVVCPRRLDLIVERAKPCTVALAAESCTPFACPFYGTDAFEPRGRAAFGGPVARVLRAGADAQIEPAGIGLIAVDVVHDPPRRRRHDPAVRQDRLVLLAPLGVPVD
jgi:hypothetical protein